MRRLPISLGFLGSFFSISFLDKARNSREKSMGKQRKENQTSSQAQHTVDKFKTIRID